MQPGAALCDWWVAPGVPPGSQTSGGQNHERKIWKEEKVNYGCSQLLTLPSGLFTHSNKCLVQSLVPPQGQDVLSWVSGSWLYRKVPPGTASFPLSRKAWLHFSIINERTLSVILADVADFTRGNKFGPDPTCAGSPSSLNASCSPWSLRQCYGFVWCGVFW